MDNISHMTKKLTSQEKLIQAACDLLVEHGGMDFTIRAVASLAGVNHGLIHHYFGGSEGLAVAAVEWYTHGVYSRVRDSLPQTQDRTLLFEHLITQVSQNRDFAKFLLGVSRLSMHMPLVKAKMAEIASLRRKQFSQVLGLGSFEEMELVQATLLGSLLLSQVDPEIKSDQILKSLAKHMDNIELTLNKSSED